MLKQVMFSLLVPLPRRSMMPRQALTPVCLWIAAPLRLTLPWPGGCNQENFIGRS